MAVHETTTTATSDPAARTTGRPLVAGFVSLKHSAAAISRGAAAYSNARLLWWPLAYLDVPLLWFLQAFTVARRPQELRTLGTASAQLSGAAGRRDRLPPAGRLLWVLLVADFVVLFGTPLALTYYATSRVILAVAALWLLLLVILPMLTFGVPALVQQYRGRGLPGWKARALEETGRRPVTVTQLGAWPATGGGRKGTGDGFALIRALAAETRQNGHIMVGVARTTTLASKYVTRTDAETSPDNPRHLRW